MFSKAFWVNSLERAVKTAAQAAVALLGVSAATPANVDVKGVLLGALFGAVLSLLTSVASTRVGDENSPSVVE